MRYVFIVSLGFVLSAFALCADAAPPATELIFPITGGSTAGSTVIWKDAAGGVPGDVFRYNINNPLGVPWMQGVACYPNATDPRPNCVMSFGWNAGSGGSILGKGGAQFSIEDHYETGPGQAQSEFHYNVFGADGVGTRALTITQQDNAPYRVQAFLFGTDLGLGVGPNLGGAAQLVQLSKDNNQVKLSSPDATRSVLVKNGLLEMKASSGGNYATATLTPDALVIAATTQGDVVNSASGTPYGRIGYARANFNAGKRWRKGAFAWGASVAGKTSERPGCPTDSDGDMTDGTIWSNTRTLNGSGSTTLEVCGCTASGVCSWHVLYDFGP